jgi:anti-anti-sigma factor
MDQGAVLTSREIGTTWEVSATGELDIASAGALAAEIRHGLEARPETLVVDLQDVGFMDSTGVHVLLDAQHRAQGQGVSLVVLRPDGACRRIFELCGVGERFPDPTARGGRTARGARFVTDWSL